MDVSKQASNAWRVTIILFLINLFNFVDRSIPAVLAEPIRHEWGLTDTELGIVVSAFTVVYALAGIPLGRLADKYPRKYIIGGSLLLWSVLTGVTGIAWNFASFLVFRVLVGIGESACAPSSTSLISDLFPASKRSRATGLFMLGLPVGLIFVFFSTGAIAEFFGTWRAPFFIAAIPGIILATCMFFIKEPVRGAAETIQVTEQKIEHPFRRIASIPTIWYLGFAFVAGNLASYGTNSFIVPLIMRYFELPLQTAGVATGIIVGLSGLIGLTLGGVIADKLHKWNERARLIYGAANMFGAAVLTYIALSMDVSEFTAFVVLFTVGWLLQYNFYICCYPAIQDVVEPRLRATAMAITFTISYVLGGSAGPIIIGALSDNAANAAMLASGATEMTDHFKGIGLRQAMTWLIPSSLALSGIAFMLATRTFIKDVKKMNKRMGMHS
ncbi:MFS transporter [Acinetobacter baumannii]|nr:MFS transporter [Acinetobacter baumannii]